MSTRPRQPDCYDYVRRFYGVPAHVGQRVRIKGFGEGVLVRKRTGLHYLWVRFDGQKRQTGPFHPTDGVEYVTTAAA